MNNLRKKILKFIKNNSKTIIFFIIGFGIGFICMFFFIPERIAKLKNGEEPIVNVKGLTISANDYYETLKDNIGIELLLQDIDKFLLDNLYKTTNEMKKEVTNNMESIIKEYTSYYNYTEKKFFENNNLRDRETFFNLLMIDYKRNLYYEDYIKLLIKDKDINSYYNNLNGDMEIKYIIAEKEDIIKKIQEALKDGKSYNEVIKTYKSSITYKNVGYVAFDNTEVDDDIYKCATNLVDNSYSKYIEVDGNYVIVFRGNTKDKEPLKDLKERIIDKIKEEKIASDTSKTLYYQSLVNLRESNDITFSDTVLEKAYKEYINTVK